MQHEKYEIWNSKTQVQNMPTVSLGKVDDYDCPAILSEFGSVVGKGKKLGITGCRSMFHSQVQKYQLLS